jgi:ribonuclease J
MDKKVSLIPIGGIGDVTKNMYLYEYGDEILIVDCGIGFADDTMPGVDLLIPDITYLKQTQKKIVGMMLTHGHEDHIGALPFILPQLPNFPIYASRLTAALANEKIKEFNLNRSITTTEFCKQIQIGSFKITPVRVTHSILDAANLLIRTPAGNFYHGSDYKFDFTPLDGHHTDIREIAKFGAEGVVCATIDALGSEKEGFSKSEQHISDSFEEQFRNTKGRLYISTYSSHISRMNQAISLAKKYNRKVALMGRSFLKVRDVARKLGYMDFPVSMEIKPNQVKNFPANQVLILVAGSQAQADSALMRIANDNDRDLTIQKDDAVIFSSDPIPGNERNVNSLVDILTKKGAKVLHGGSADYFHVSGHGSQGDIKLMISLTNPQFLVPIGGQYHHMVSFQEIAVSMGYQAKNVVLLDDGLEVIFADGKYQFGRKIPSKSVLVDQITGGEMENYVVRDRLKLSQEGIAIVMVEVDPENGNILAQPDIITKGFVYPNKKVLANKLQTVLKESFANKKGKVSNWVFYKKIVEEKAEQLFFKEGREPLIVPVIIES